MVRRIFATYLARQENKTNISPPIAVLAILAIGIAVTVWLVPPKSEPPAGGKVSLSDTTYGTLVLWAEDYVGADGRPLATEQATEGLANRSLKERNV